MKEIVFVVMIILIIVQNVNILIILYEVMAIVKMETVVLTIEM